jgi:hypothetical protein
VSVEAPRALPIRVEPQPDEAVDSWFDALAHRLQVAVTDLLPAIGLSRSTRRYANRARDIPADWTILLREAEADALAHASGVPADAIHAMTLMRYDRRAVLIDHATRRVNIRILWGRGVGSRYCPDCLTESGGRWQVRWRLNWSFACLVHRRLLADYCPHCRGDQRTRSSGRHEPPRPGFCAHPVDPQHHQPLRGRSGAHVRCHGNLGQAETLVLPADHPAFHAQRSLEAMFASDTADFGVYARQPQPAVGALADIRSIAGRVVAQVLNPEPGHGPRLDLAGMLPKDPVTIRLISLAREEHQRTPTRAQKRPGTVAPTSAAGVAVGAIAACTVLACADPRDAARILQPLVTMPRGRRAIIVTPSNVDDWGTTTTSVLHGIQLIALGERLRPTDQLRYRGASTAPRQPDLDEASLQRRVQAIPSLFWPDWTVRVSPPQGARIRVLRPVLSAALLLPGTRLNLTDTAQLLGSVTRCFEISIVVQMLHAHQRWPQMAAALLRLVEHLDSHPVPIDYQRRRRLAYGHLLPQAEWSRICRAAGIRPGQPIRWHVARAVLFEQIGGMPARLAPFGTGAATAAFRTKMNAFPTRMTPELADGLHTAAARFLARQGAEGEPVRWSPPLNLLDGLDLPGTDIRQVDLNQLHHLVRTDRAGTAVAGRRLGVSSFTAHTLLMHHPAPRLTVDPATRRPVREILTPDLLARYHHDEHLSQTQIDHRIRLVRGTAARLAADYGIPVRGGKKDHGRSPPRPTPRLDIRPVPQPPPQPRRPRPRERTRQIHRAPLGQDLPATHPTPPRRPHEHPRRRGSCTTPTPTSDYRPERMATPQPLRRSHPTPHLRQSRRRARNPHLHPHRPRQPARTRIRPPPPGTCRRHTHHATHRAGTGRDSCCPRRRPP